MTMHDATDPRACLVDGFMKAPLTRRRFALRRPGAALIDEHDVHNLVHLPRGDTGRRDEHPRIPPYRNVARTAWAKPGLLYLSAGGFNRIPDRALNPRGDRPPRPGETGPTPPAGRGRPRRPPAIPRHR